jgi:glycosyl-4,4'-diaponeurosporenoate acyltransferase
MHLSTGDSMAAGSQTRFRRLGARPWAAFGLTMSNVRDLTVLSLVAASFAASLILFRRAVGLTSPWFGVILMLSVLGVVAFVRPLFHLKLPGFLRKTRSWEARGRLYNVLGVQAFGTLLRRAPLRQLNPLVYMTRFADPTVVRAQIESAEAAHVLAAGFLIPHMVYACVHRWWAAMVWLLIVQVALNFYPILHLRWARIRIDRFQERGLSRHSGAV